MKVYFKNIWGERRVIAEIQSENEMGKVISDFIAQCNAKKPAGAKPFVSYYTRSWETEDGLIQYDVGSHTDFFFLEK